MNLTRTTGVLLIIVIISSWCPNDKGMLVKQDQSGDLNEYPKEMVIIFNRNEEHTSYKDTSIPSRPSFEYRRDGFRDSLFFIQVSHGLQYKTKKINKVDLGNRVVRFDAEMGLEDWIYMDVLNYYIIFQDEYLSEESLAPNHEFTAYEVALNIGGVEY